MCSRERLCFVIASNDEGVLASCLLASPELEPGLEVSVQRGAMSAAQAHNRGLAATNAEIVVFAHQDVFLPPGWLVSFHTALEWLQERDPQWGVVGVYGMTHYGEARGWAYSTGLGEVLGGAFSTPEPVRTLDELLLVVRRASGLRFDERLPGFHMYGTDICLEAEQCGLRNYVVPCFTLHNSNGLRRLPWPFWRACLHVWRTRQNCLPVQSPCVSLTRTRFGLAKRALRSWLYASLRQQGVGRRVADPAALYARLVRDGVVPAAWAGVDQPSAPA